ncbi:MAG: MFS transporter [Flavobacteriales bacterium]|nr:MFS transporter [Flavobacteriales bacterium]
MLEKNNPKTIKAWAFYDWANSVYSLVISTAIFPIFYSKMTTETFPDGTESMNVTFLGRSFINTEIYSYVLSLSFLIVAAMSPFLSGIADYTGSKKKFMKFFCYLGSGSCAALFFFNPAHLELSLLFVLLASVGFWGSLVFYNSFLPEIATVDRHDEVSAKGFSYGYIGSSILLIVILIIIMMIDTTETKESTRYMFLLVAVWWAGFAQVTYRALPDNVYERTPGDTFLWKGYEELKKVLVELRPQVNLKRFLRSFFVYSMGVQTVMVMAVLFAKKEIDWGGDGDSGLIISVLIIQFVAVAGAYLFAKLSSKIGNIAVLIIALAIWVGICIAAYFIQTSTEFYILAGFVGLVMGGIQSLSRSTYSKLLPQTKDHASYFSFYDVVEKLGIVIGTFLFGAIEGYTESMRNSALVLLSFFLIGGILLLFVKNEDKLSATKHIIPSNE